MRPEFLLHESMALSPSSPTHSSHTSYPILVIAIVGILAIAFLLVCFYIIVIKWHRIDPIREFSFSRTRPRFEDPLMIHTYVEENRGLEEGAIRAIPILEFKKDEKVENAECTVCLNEFQENERLRSIPNCSHMFHIDCIDVWLQNNANCPLCRNSISISSTTKYPINQFMFPISYLPQNPNLHSDNFNGRDEAYVDIEIGGGEQNHSIDNTNRMLHKKRGKEFSHASSMGDECVDNQRKDEQFLVQPIRRSISMDSANDRHLYLAVQEIIQKHRQKTEDVSPGEGSSNRVKKSFFSFGNSRGSKSSILPVDLEM
ncbi:hypothetical protein Leryth_027376 [Lithospermum erythrorhizon]|uniref:RING-type E3 ubiquitin transferase n=1 Tax=Lithospermum erythrorhizon TaxID=34254 RepID=A0AAV3Q6R7_LITER|nr:hypothetical protein Leryth_027376 [Lithospermum erythrorhizon]